MATAIEYGLVASLTAAALIYAFSDNSEEEIGFRQEAKIVEETKVLPQNYSFKVCNNSATKIFVAFGYFEKPSDDFALIKGWINIDEDKCGNIINSKFGANDNASVYYYIEDSGSGHWNGNEAIKYCIPNEKFERKNTKDYQCKPDENLKSFGKIIISKNEPNRTLTLND